MNDISALLGVHPDSSSLIDFLASLVSTAQPIVPEVKSYSDAVYFNYFPLGLSLLFSPTNGYTPSSALKLSDLKNAHLVLDTIYCYNVPQKSSDDRVKGTSSRTAELAFSTYPITPLVLPLRADLKDNDGKPLSRPPQIDVLTTTSGKDFVQALGEPDRKGGGAGPSAGSIGIWCEWSRDGIMVEFGGDEAKGPQAWERGKDAVWKIVTLFSATS